MTAPVSTQPDDEMAEFDDAWEMLNYYLSEWGLESLSGKAKDMLVEGDSIEVITLKLAETDEYKQRFRANDARKKAGLRVLSPAEYIEVERQYRETLRRHGLPEGFYDSLDDYTGFIENDLSPQELDDRASEAQARYLNADAAMKGQMDRFMNELGVRPNQIVASMLDPDRALPDLQRTINSASIAAEAARAFDEYTRLDSDRARDLAAQGVDTADARRAFGELSGRQDRDQFLGRLSGTQITEEELENELLLNDQSAAQERRRALQAERGRFSGNYLATEAGRSLASDTSGSY